MYNIQAYANIQFYTYIIHVEYCILYVIYCMCIQNNTYIHIHKYVYGQIYILYAYICICICMHIDIYIICL